MEIVTFDSVKKLSDKQLNKVIKATIQNYTKSLYIVDPALEIAHMSEYQLRGSYGDPVAKHSWRIRVSTIGQLRCMIPSNWR